MEPCWKRGYRHLGRRYWIYLRHSGVFFVMALMGGMALFCLWGIAPRHIDYAVARGLNPDSIGHAALKSKKLYPLFTDKSLLVVGMTLFFFHLGNAALLPLLGQSAVARFEVNAAAYTAGTVVLAQTTMILTALWGAHIAQKKGYGPLFYMALLALPLRGCIAGLWNSPWSIIPVQLLDGVGAGLLGRGDTRHCRPSSARRRAYQYGAWLCTDYSGRRGLLQQRLRRPFRPPCQLLAPLFSL